MPRSTSGHHEVADEEPHLTILSEKAVEEDKDVVEPREEQDSNEDPMVSGGRLVNRNHHDHNGGRTSTLTSGAAGVESLSSPGAGEAGPTAAAAAAAAAAPSAASPSHAGHGGRPRFLLLSYLRKLTLAHWIMLSLLLGILIGIVAPQFAVGCQPLSSIFLRMIKCLVVPLIFSTLVVGIAGHGDDLQRLGRIAIKALIYFEVVTTFALAVGLIAVNISKPGIGVNLSNVTASNQPATLDVSFEGFVDHMIPESFFEAASSNNVLQIVFASVIFSIALTQLDRKHRDFMISFCQSLSETMFKVTTIVMYYSPIGIGAAIAVTVGNSGAGVLLNLGKLIITLIVALIVFLLCVLLPDQCQDLCDGHSGASFDCLHNLFIGGRTAKGLGGPRETWRPALYSVICGLHWILFQSGWQLPLSVASVFCAQARVNNPFMSWGEQILMMLTLMIASKGVAAIPRGSIVVLAAVVQNFGLPLEAVTVILGVDSIMNMCRAFVNVVGNCLAACLLAKWENELAEPLGTQRKKPAHKNYSLLNEVDQPSVPDVSDIEAGVHAKGHRND